MAHRVHDVFVAGVFLVVAVDEDRVEALFAQQGHGLRSVGIHLAEPGPGIHPGVFDQGRAVVDVQRAREFQRARALQVFAGDDEGSAVFHADFAVAADVQAGQRDGIGRELVRHLHVLQPPIAVLLEGGREQHGAAAQAEPRQHGFEGRAVQQLLPRRLPQHVQNRKVHDPQMVAGPFRDPPRHRPRQKRVGLFQRFLHAQSSREFPELSRP